MSSFTNARMCLAEAGANCATWAAGAVCLTRTRAAQQCHIVGVDYVFITSDGLKKRQEFTPEETP